MGNKKMKCDDCTRTFPKSEMREIGECGSGSYKIIRTYYLCDRCSFYEAWKFYPEDKDIFDDCRSKWDNQYQLSKVKERKMELTLSNPQYYDAYWYDQDRWHPYAPAECLIVKKNKE